MAHANFHKQAVGTILGPALQEAEKELKDAEGRVSGLKDCLLQLEGIAFEVDRVHKLRLLESMLTLSHGDDIVLSLDDLELLRVVRTRTP